MNEIDIQIEKDFSNIIMYENDCKYRNCTHASEKGCAVLEAVEKGIIMVADLKDYHKYLRNQLFLNNNIEYKKSKEKFKLKVSKHFKTLIDNQKKEVKELEEDIRVAEQEGEE